MHCLSLLVLVVVMFSAHITSYSRLSLCSKRFVNSKAIITRSMSVSMNMQSFSFLSPRLVIGAGVLPTALQSVGISKDSKILVVSGASNRYSDLLAKQFKDNKLVHYHVMNEPTVENAIECSKIGRDNNVDYVISIGGGSAIDLGKVVAALITNEDDIYNYLEVVGKAKPIQNKPKPFIAVPTTSGTGSECTKNAVLKCVKNNRKASIRHDMMIPSLAIIDPLLTLTVPSHVTAHVGLDALCQLIEPFTSNLPNPITDALAKEGITRAVRSLKIAVNDGSNVSAREDMAVASCLSGLCLANSKLGAVHGFASVLGGMFETAPHGAICALLMPPVFKKNIDLLNKLSINGDKIAAERLQRYTQVAAMVTGNPSASALDGADWIEQLVRELKVPTLSVLCKETITNGHITEIVSGTAVASSTKGNPVTLSNDELKAIIQSVV